MSRKPARHAAVLPTDAEWEMLHTLWALNRPASVPELQAILDASSERTRGYTGYLKLLQVMTEKGLVRIVDRRYRAHLYTPRISRAKLERRAAQHFVATIGGGSLPRSVEIVLRCGTLSQDEREHLRILLQ